MVQIPFFNIKLEKVRSLWLAEESLRPRSSLDIEFLYMLSNAATEKSETDSTLRKRLERARNDNNLSESYLAVLKRMYPGAADLWNIGTEEEFYKQINDRERWIAGQKLFISAVNERRLELIDHLSSHYSSYSSKIGLILRSEWLAKKPVNLTVETEKQIIKFQHNQFSGRPEKIDDSGLDFFDLKQLCSPNPLWDSLCYRTLQIGYSNTLDCPNFVFGEGKYRDFYSTCEFLPFKLCKWIDENKKNGHAGLPNWWETNPDIPSDSRCLVPGVSTLTIFVDKNYSNNSVFLIHHRSSEVQEMPNFTHVGPSGSFQPAAPNFSHPTDCSFISNILREFAEEFFGCKEDTERQDHDKDGAASLEGKTLRLEKNKVVMSLREGINKENVRIYFLGVGLDPCNLKPEILTLMIVGKNRIIDLRKTLDNSRTRRKDFDYEGKFEDRVFSKTILEECIAGYKWVPAGRACLQLALEHFPFINQQIGAIRQNI